MRQPLVDAPTALGSFVDALGCERPQLRFRTGFFDVCFTGVDFFLTTFFVVDFFVVAFLATACFFFEVDLACDDLGRDTLPMRPALTLV